jgi:hypothetical protein
MQYELELLPLNLQQLKLNYVSVLLESFLEVESP